MAIGSSKQKKNLKNNTKDIKVKEAKDIVQF
jgi:hypothetical protein